MSPDESLYLIDVVVRHSMFCPKAVRYFPSIICMSARIVTVVLG